eukprot:CAMPEP_0178374658 /NCGR_PEP_ID=MMETSP0689_2-20121128/2489_1 /TAXON_ID=160604 /ORGANISM="Amphidinium massartii, Strain CS-259" /LENGTH=526 /DNA_ID=CAMNT_0019994633 /DNA_START=16 /DNA_END=1593 /DNA_ORIENTATION=+
MAKLYDEIFKDEGSGDIYVYFPNDDRGRRLRCHSLVLTQNAYFYKMLAPSSMLREGRSGELVVNDSYEEFLELLRFLYTGQIEINTSNAPGLLALSDKYCIDDVLDLCLKFVQLHFSADLFFNLYSLSLLNTSFQEKLKEQLMAALTRRRNFCAVTQDRRWAALSIDFVEELLSHDDLPVMSEAEVLGLIDSWTSASGNRQDTRRLLGTFRKGESVSVHISEIEAVVKALGVPFLSNDEPRTGAAVWDPLLLLHQPEAAGKFMISPQPAPSVDPPSAGILENVHVSESSNLFESRHLLGPKDVLRQEPGWLPPGVRRCRVILESTSWSHRERRLLRNSRTCVEVGYSKRGFQEQRGTAALSAPERSPSPPPKPKFTTFDAFDAGQMTDDQDRVLGASVRRTFQTMQDKMIEHDLVDHHIICGVLSGYQRHGIRCSQKERSAIYVIEDLTGKQCVTVGGTTTSVTFDLVLDQAPPSNNNISQCRFAVMRDTHTLLEECFDVSAKVPMCFYISSMSFDSSSNYSVVMR